MPEIEEKYYLLLSIKGKFAEAIKLGSKTWEYRKVVPTKKIIGIVFYCPEENDFVSVHSPIKMKVGTPEEISSSCIDNPAHASSLLRYYSDRKKVVAYKLEENKFLAKGTKNILEKEMNASFKAPQGFQYINAAHPLNNILELNL